MLIKKGWSLGILRLTQPPPPHFAEGEGGGATYPLHPQRESNNDTLTIADSHTHSQHKVVHMATQEKGYINLLFVHYILKKQGGPSGY
jgi:hypothetical protein